MRGTFHGSCHCGAVQFEADIDIAPQPAAPWSESARYAWTYKCNCTYCTKTRFWKLFVPASAFRLLSDEATLGDYLFEPRMVHHRFCTQCGVTPFASGELEQMGGRFYALNIGSLDDAAPADLAALPIRYEDGRHDAWDQEPVERQHL